MRGVGAWLAAHGAALYGTRGGPWKPGRYGASTCAGSRVNIRLLDRTLRDLRLPALPVGVAPCRADGTATPHRTAGGIFEVALPPAR